MERQVENAPTQKEVVLALMKPEGRETRCLVERSTGRTVNKVFVTYRCPRPHCRVKPVSFRENSGYNNPYSHLKSCYGKGVTPIQQSKYLKELFIKARSEMREAGGTISSHFSVNSLTEYDQAAYGWMRLVVLRNTLLAHIQDKESRKWFRYPVNVSQRAIVRAIFNLVRMPEGRIGSEMKGTRCAVVFDGWSSSRAHYVAIFASYCVRKLVRENSILCEKEVPYLSLIALSPMS